MVEDALVCRAQFDILRELGVLRGQQRQAGVVGAAQFLASALDKLNARGRGASAQAVLLRMKLAALTAELVAADVIERARQRSAIS